MNDLMTKKERKTLERRHEIAEALKNGKTYDEIKRELGTSNATIAAVVKLMERSEE